MGRIQACTINDYHNEEFPGDCCSERELRNAQVLGACNVNVLRERHSYPGSPIGRNISHNRNKSEQRQPALSTRDGGAYPDSFIGSFLKIFTHTESGKPRNRQDSNTKIKEAKTWLHGNPRYRLKNILSQSLCERLKKLRTNKLLARHIVNA
jgi:hypothetical protein